MPSGLDARTTFALRTGAGAGAGAGTGAGLGAGAGLGVGFLGAGGSGFLGASTATLAVEPNPSLALLEIGSLRLGDFSRFSCVSSSFSMIKFYWVQ